MIGPPWAGVKVARPPEVHPGDLACRRCLSARFGHRVANAATTSCACNFFRPFASNGRVKKFARADGASRAGPKCAIGARNFRLVYRSLRTVEEDNSLALMAHRGPVPFRNRRKSDGDIETVRRVVCAQRRLYTVAPTCIRKTRTCK